ncbi:MAG: hypothetical protein DRH10_09945 [Deltaproteobacteria bacterium]|nr:MAG: hypothetical protein DRH10_09945 [Deltaproteobacteria bacterium]
MKNILLFVLLSTISAVVLAGGLGTLVYPPFKHTWGITKGTEAKLDMLLGNKTDFDNPQGLVVVRLEVWDDPDNDKDDDELTAYGVNSNRGQIIYNKSMYALALYGETGSGKNQFSRPRGIAADPKGDVFVCDTGNRRVVHLYNGGKELEWVGSFGEDLFKEPHGVSITEAGTLFVTDRARGTIELFTYDGEHIRTLGGFVYPTGIAVDHPKITKTRYGESAIYVIDNDGTELRKVNYRGQVTATVRITDIPAQTGKLSYLALDFYDNVWITDSVSCRIHKFDKDLRYITSFGECGDGDYRFDHPTGIAIWRRFGQVVIAERHSAQYLWIGTDIARLDAAMGEGRDGNPAIKINFFLTDRSYITVNIKRKGELVRRLYEHKRFKQGARTITWDMLDDTDNRVPAGEYEIEFVIEPTYSSYTYFEKEVSTSITLGD